MTTLEVNKFIQWTSREGWEYNWKTDLYEYKPLVWAPRTFAQILKEFKEKTKESK